VRAEHEVFGISHPEVGFVVATNWALPAPISESIRFHQQPERAQDFPELVQLIALASQLTDHLELPEVMPLERCLPAALDFGIEEHRLTGILDIARALRSASNE
jgi:hypothetical protein